MDLDAGTVGASCRPIPTSPSASRASIILKDSPTSTVIELDVMIDGQPAHHDLQAFRDQFLDAIRLDDSLSPAPALRSWVQGQGFRERGLPTARPLAVLHRRRHGLYREGYLLTEKIENAQDLARFPGRPEPAVGRCASYAMLRGQIAQVATVLRELHRRHLVAPRSQGGQRSGQPRPHHLFFARSPTKPGRPARPVFCPSSRPRSGSSTLVGVRRYHSLSRSRKVQNLARLNASFQTGKP